MNDTVEQTLSRALAVIASSRSARVLQIGAGDGRTGDHLHGFLTTQHCKGVLLEPVQHIYQQLCQTYAGFEHITCLQRAVSSTPGSRTIYLVRDLEGLPWWADQLPSFSKATVLSHTDRIPDLPERVVTETVDCITPALLMMTAGWESVDVLAVDTEGHDAIVVNGFLDIGQDPEVILFEHKHLSDQDYRDVMHRLLASNYHITASAADTLCCSRAIMNQLATSPADT